MRNPGVDAAMAAMTSLPLLDVAAGAEKDEVHETTSGLMADQPL